MPSVGFASFAQFASQVLQVCAPVRDSARIGEPRTSGRELRELERMRSRFVWIFFMESTTQEKLWGPRVALFPQSFQFVTQRDYRLNALGWIRLLRAIRVPSSPSLRASSGFGAHWRAQDFWTRIARTRANAIEVRLDPLHGVDNTREPWGPRVALFPTNHFRDQAGLRVECARLDSLRSRNSRLKFSKSA